MDVSFSVIGAGNLGSALTRALARAGFRCVSVFNRTPAVAESLAAEIDSTIVSGSFPAPDDPLGDVVFLCVPDSRISEVSEKLAAECRTGKATVVHTSGTSPASVLQAPAAGGAATAAFHPLQTFSGDSSPGVFRDISISIQGDERAIPPLQAMALALGSRPIVVSETDKQRLHIAAVFASNYLVTLMDLARQTVEAPELKEELPEMFYPLMRQTLENLRQHGVEQALTGPVSRGDGPTVSSHLEQLADDPELAKIYRILAEYTLPVAERSGKPDPQQVHHIRSLLDE